METDSFFNTDNSPSSAFYFAVQFSGFPEMSSSFQEVSGLKVTLGTEEGKEGGENEFLLHIPTHAKYENLVLKRCLLYNPYLNKWCKEAFEDFKFSPMDIKLQLLGVDGGSLASWSINQAYPISWELTALNGTDNQPAIETLTLKYRNFRKD